MMVAVDSCQEGRSLWRQSLWRQAKVVEVEVQTKRRMKEEMCRRTRERKKKIKKREMGEGGIYTLVVA
jgi:hypothetical protein